PKGGKSPGAVEMELRIRSVQCQRISELGESLATEALPDEEPCEQPSGDNRVLGGRDVAGLPVCLGGLRQQSALFQECPELEAVQHRVRNRGDPLARTEPQTNEPIDELHEQGRITFDGTPASP